MADNHVTLNTGKRLGFEAQNCANMGAQLRHHLAQLKAVVDAMEDGTTRAQIEAALGLDPGKGPDFVYLLANAKGALDAAGPLNQFIDWLGGLT